MDQVAGLNLHGFSTNPSVINPSAQPGIKVLQPDTLLVKFQPRLNLIQTFALHQKIRTAGLHAENAIPLGDPDGTRLPILLQASSWQQGSIKGLGIAR